MLCRIPVCMGLEGDQPGLTCIPANQLNDTVELLGKWWIPIPCVLNSIGFLCEIPVSFCMLNLDLRVCIYLATIIFIRTAHNFPPHYYYNLPCMQVPLSTSWSPPRKCYLRKYFIYFLFHRNHSNSRCYDELFGSTGYPAVSLFFWGKYILYISTLSTK